MTRIEFLKQQITETRNFTNRLIEDIPQTKWFEIPKGTNSNLAWQIGHILLAQNFHILACSLGRNPEVMKRIPMEHYSNVCRGLGSDERSVKRDDMNINELLEQYAWVHTLCMDGLESTNDSMLDEPINKIPFKHPIAKTKYDAISWSFKHEMWHCGEIEQIKMALGIPFRWVS